MLPPSPLLPPLAIGAGARILSYLDAFHREWHGGEHVVLLDGEFHALAMSVADHLAEAKVRVTFVTEIEKPGIRLDAQTQKMWFRRLCTRGVVLLPFRKLVGVSAEGAQLKYVHNDSIE